MCRIVKQNSQEGLGQSDPMNQVIVLSVIILIDFHSIRNNSSRLRKRFFLPLLSITKLNKCRLVCDFNCWTVKTRILK